MRREVENMGKKIVIGLIRFYKVALSPYKGRSYCNYVPSCSQYAIEAFKRHGAVKGLILTVWRVCRCNPWNVGGIDYVPKKFQLSRKNNHEKPE